MKNYHIVRITPLLNVTLRNYVNNRRDFADLSYSELYQALFKEHYNYSDCFSYEMQRLGNRCEELVYDCELLQRKWVEENNADIDFSSYWQLKVIVAQLKALNPDFIYIQGFTRITPQDISEFSSEFPNLKKVFVHSGYPGMVEGFTSDTVVFCGLPLIKNMFLKEGLDAHLLYHGFDRRIYDLLGESPTESSLFSFMGSSGYGYGLVHKVRFWELLKLADKTPIQLWLDERDDYAHTDQLINPFSVRPLKEKFYDHNDCDWDTYPLPISPLRYLVAPEKVHGPIYGMDFFRCMHNSLLTYHRHGDFPEVGAMRLFQATGVGTCLVTDSGSNMADLYDADTELVTYASLAECVEKVNYLLANPAKAREIALRGQKRTLQDHTLAHRYKQVHACLQQYL